jgi:hypothetical protein
MASNKSTLFDRRKQAHGMARLTSWTWLMPLICVAIVAIVTSACSPSGSSTGGGTSTSTPTSTTGSGSAPFTYSVIRRPSLAFVTVPPNTPPNAPLGALAQCLPGEQLLSGGYYDVLQVLQPGAFPPVTPLVSGPLLFNPSTWQVQAFNQAPVNMMLYAFADCLQTTPFTSVNVSITATLAVNVAANSGKSLTANCPQGAPTGGGYTVKAAADAAPVIFGSHQVGPQAWQVTLGTGIEPATNFQVFVLCARAHLTPHVIAATPFTAQAFTGLGYIPTIGSAGCLPTDVLTGGGFNNPTKNTALVAFPFDAPSPLANLDIQPVQEWSVAVYNAETIDHQAEVWPTCVTVA